MQTADNSPVPNLQFQLRPGRGMAGALEPDHRGSFGPEWGRGGLRSNKTDVTVLSSSRRPVSTVGAVVPRDKSPVTLCCDRSTVPFEFWPPARWKALGGEGWVGKREKTFGRSPKRGLCLLGTNPPGERGPGGAA